MVIPSTADNESKREMKSGGWGGGFWRIPVCVLHTGCEIYFGWLVCCVGIVKKLGSWCLGGVGVVGCGLYVQLDN